MLAEPNEISCELARYEMRRRRSGEGYSRSDTGRSRKGIFSGIITYEQDQLMSWRGAGVVELAALEKRYGASYRGFESLPLRQN